MIRELEFDLKSPDVKLKLSMRIKRPRNIQGESVTSNNTAPEMSPLLANTLCMCIHMHTLTFNITMVRMLHIHLPTPTRNQPAPECEGIHVKPKLKLSFNP